jgi:hypothetical protein
MAQKFKLDYIPDFDFILLGLVSFEKDYRLGWEMNQSLQMDFTRSSDHSLKHRKTGQEQQFSCFIYEDDEAYITYKMLSNRSENGYLLEELKNLDYLIVITGECNEDYAADFREKLLGLESVQACFVLDPETLKGCERVI